MDKSWAERIADLKAAGMTYAEIGERTGMAGSTIGDLATGRSKSPRWEGASRLLKLHEACVLLAAPRAADTPDAEPEIPAEPPADGWGDPPLDQVA